jgi:hypothetical protein
MLPAPSSCTPMVPSVEGSRWDPVVPIWGQIIGKVMFPIVAEAWRLAYFAPIADVRVSFQTHV